MTDETSIYPCIIRSDGKGLPYMTFALKGGGELNLKTNRIRFCRKRWAVKCENPQNLMDVISRSPPKVYQVSITRNRDALFVPFLLGSLLRFLRRVCDR